MLRHSGQDSWLQRADGIARNEAEPVVVMEYLQNVRTSGEIAAISKWHFCKVDFVKLAKLFCKPC